MHKYLYYNNITILVRRYIINCQSGDSPFSDIVGKVLLMKSPYEIIIIINEIIVNCSQPSIPQPILRVGILL